MFFVDASAATASAAGGEASLVKLAVLHRRPGGGWERLYAPLVRGAGAPPVLYIPGGERVRQAVVYVVELAALLALARAGSVEGQRLGERRVLIRHGPLVQQLAHYYSRVYDVEEEVAEAALRYAGLGPGETSRLIRMSKPRDTRGVVNLGFLASALLAEIARAAGESRGRLLFAGVVENTSRSRVLVTDILAEATLEAAKIYRPMTPSDLGHALAGLVNLWAAGYGGRHNHSLQECLCGAAAPSPSPDTVAAEYVAPLQAELQSRLGASLLQGQLPSVEDAAAALSSSGAAPDLTDSELLYNLLYLEPCRLLGGSPCIYTWPRSRAQVSVWAALSLRQRSNRLPAGIAPDKLEALTAAPRRVSYTYMLVDEPPGCSSLLQRARALGMSVCSLTDLVHVSPAIRVEWMNPVDESMLWGLLRVLREASRLVLYAYPPQLLVVDRASRVSWAEYRSLEILAEELARRRQPYRGFLRGWEARATLAWQTW